jgi:lysophospholipase L1-like esterase
MRTPSPCRRACRRWFLGLACGLAIGLAAARVSAATATVTNEHSRWEKEIAAFEASDRTNPPPQGAILFIGSSSIRMWRTLAQDFPQHQVINRGFGGSEVTNSYHFAERIVFPYAPKLIVLYAGGNDLNAKKTPERVFHDFKAFVEKVRAQLPATRIAYISIAPNPARWAQIEQVRQANRMINDYTNQDPNLMFIDTFSEMLGPDGLPKPDIFLDDRLHMNANGYAIWKKVVGEYLPKP